MPCCTVGICGNADLSGWERFTQSRTDRNERRKYFRSRLQNAGVVTKVPTSAAATMRLPLKNTQLEQGQIRRRCILSVYALKCNAGFASP